MIHDGLQSGMYTAAKQWAAAQNMSEEEFGLGDREQLLKKIVAIFDIPTGTVGDPDDVGKTVAMFCSEFAKYTVGQSLIVDGGLARLM